MSNNPTRNPGSYVIGTNEQGDFTRVPASNPNIGTNEHGDFVRVPADPNRGMANNTKDDANKFQIFVYNFSDTKTYTFDVLSTYTVGQLMDMIQRDLQIPKELQRLVYTSKNLLEHKLLSDYNIQRHATLNLVGRLRGGQSISLNRRLGTFD